MSDEIKIDWIKVIRNDYQNRKNKFIEFKNVDGFAMGEKEIDYEKDKIVFIKQKNSQKNGSNIKILKNNLYKEASDYLEDKSNNKHSLNLALDINKFNNELYYHKLYYRREIEKEIIKKVKNYMESIHESLKEYYEVISFEATLVDKLLIGLGNQSVYENGLILHHTYGIPYIPGSTIKGVLRNYIINEYFNIEHNDDKNFSAEKVSLKNEDFINIFGGGEENNAVEGKVIFFDAFPTTDFKISSDIMTPHHSKYYAIDDELPLDSDDVNPIKFLAVEEAKFKFSIAIDKRIANKFIKLGMENQNDSIKIKQFLKETLKDVLMFSGIGAKTAVGYGYFEITDKENDVLDDKGIENSVAILNKYFKGGN